MAVTADVQWARYGRAADMAGSRVLSCSTGRLNRNNFGEAIGRFSPGTLDALPQVTLSYVSSRASDGNYIALAIHKFADQDRDVRSDEAGRPVVLTSYFCVPYLPLASAAIGYLPLYLGLRPAKLPEQDGPPLRVMLPTAGATAASAAVSVLARQVASLLITGSPVCVIGASSASVTERLQFIDSVMALLPYGYRTRMTAATWVRPTHRDHRFRLYFSDAARDHSPPDHVVWWGRPEQTPLTPAHGDAYQYQQFLEDEPRKTDARLSGQTDPHGFKLEELRKVLARLGVTEPEPAPDDARARKPSQPPEQTTGNGEHDPCEAILERCAAQVRAPAPDLASLAIDISRLRRLAASGGLSDSQRAKYRELIAGHGLLTHSPALEQQAARLYDTLLPLAFGKPLTYEGYCQVEDCLEDPEGMPSNKILLRAIERCGMAEIPVTALVLTHLGQQQKLRAQFASPQFSAGRLISLLAGRWDRPRHFRVVCDVTLDYLTIARTRYEPAALLRALRQHGFLAQALLTAGSKDQYQVHALYRLLKAAYPNGLSRTAVPAVLRASYQSPLTPALFAAVLMLASPEDALLARDLYVTALLTGLAVDADTSRRIERLLPVLDQTSGSFLRTRMSQPVPGRDGTGDDVPGPGTR
jgi:hypothetical protein